MAVAIILPKLGNTVESAILLSWHVAVGESVSVGDVLCEIETDKATLEIESTASGILLAQLSRVGDEVPVMSNIALVGQEGESVDEFMPQVPIPQPHPAVSMAGIPQGETASSESGRADAGSSVKVSPRARNLAQRKGIDYDKLSGSGPGGRIIERDVEAALRERVKVTPVAQAMLSSGDFRLDDDPPADGRVTKADLIPASESRAVKEIPLKGVRKIIAKRMLESLQTTAQLTLNATADARALLAFRRRLKESDAALGLRAVSINDLLLLAVSRTLPAFPELNALFEDDTIYQHEAVQLAMAVDTDRGLLAPVIGNADALTLKQISAEAYRLSEASRSGKIQPDALNGGTFTVSNLGALGIESFTPVLNPPQVAILGIGSINLKPVQVDGDVEFVPHIGLSLTINHQVVDGAPAARCLAALGKNLAQIDLLVAL